MGLYGCVWLVGGGGGGGGGYGCGVVVVKEYDEKLYLCLLYVNSINVCDIGLLVGLFLSAFA